MSKGRPKKEVPESVEEKENITSEVVDDNKIEDTTSLLDPKDTYKMRLDEAGQAEDGYNVEIIRDFDGKVDIFYLNKTDPKFEYRWLRDDYKNISIKTTNLLFDKGGWQLVSRKHLLEKMELKQRELSPEGLYRRGDQILAYMPKELYREKMVEKAKKANAPMDRVSKLIGDEGKGVKGKGDPDAGKGVHHSFKGFQTQEDLDM